MCLNIDYTKIHCLRLRSAVVDFLNLIKGRRQLLKCLKLVKLEEDVALKLEEEVLLKILLESNWKKVKVDIKGGGGYGTSNIGFSL